MALQMLVCNCHYLSSLAILAKADGQCNSTSTRLQAPHPGLNLKQIPVVHSIYLMENSLSPYPFQFHSLPHGYCYPENQRGEGPLLVEIPKAGCEAKAHDSQRFLTLDYAYSRHACSQRSVVATATHALVISWLDYCNTLYMGLPLKSVQKLQWIQNATATTPLLQQLY